MAQVSFRFVSPAVKRKMGTLLVDCVSRCRDQNIAADFLDGLLTKTEKIMLAKRISIALMLLKGNDYSEIEKVLKVSKATVWRVKSWLDVKGAGLENLLEEVISRDEKATEEREDLLRAAKEDNPMWQGPINWSSYKKRQWQKVRETKKEPF